MNTTIYMIENFFVGNFTKDQRSIPKNAGWRWHGGNCLSRCLACRAGVPLWKWYTPDTSKVVSLTNYCAQPYKNIVPQPSYNPSISNRRLISF